MKPLFSDRLILRPFTMDDLIPFYEIMADQEVNTFLPWWPLTSLEQARTWITQHYLEPTDQGIHLAITLKSNHQVIGYINVGEGPSFDFGYGLAKAHWRQGYAHEAAACLITKLRELGYPYITATHDIHNPYSGYVMQRLKMTYGYSYIESWQPKNQEVTFRLYQLNLNGDHPIFPLYREKYPWFIEPIDTKKDA